MKRESGTTLIEMLVTLLVAGIFISIVGLIMIVANTWWIRSNSNIRLQDDMRYARRRLAWLVSNADMTPFVVDSAHTCMTFNGGDRIRLDGNRVLYVPSKGEQETILSNVDTFEILSGDDLSADYHILQVNKQGTVMFKIAAKTRATGNAKDGDVSSSLSFIVKNTNFGT